MTDHVSRWVAGSLLVSLLAGPCCAKRDAIDLDAPDAAPGSMALEFEATACDPAAACKLVTAGAAKGSYAMSKTLTCCLAAVIAACGPINPPPNPPPSPGGAGGSVATGGAMATGGVISGGMAGQAGSVATGGSPATGGAPACAPFVEPICATSGTVLSPERKAQLKRQLTGWHRSPGPIVNHWRPTYSITQSCSVMWAPNNLLPFDQRYGSCTANAVGGVLSTKPFAGKLTQDDVDERIYPLATKLDPYPGNFPPNDTGSNGSSAWKAAVQLGYTDIPSTPIGSLEELQAAMQKTSCILGVDWYDSMFSPTRCGELTIGGAIAGGHEVHVIGINLDLKKVWIRNSWSMSWGLSRGNEMGGYAYMSFGTLQKLLNAGGELDCAAYPPAAKLMQWSDAF